MKGFYVDLVRAKRLALLVGPFRSEPIARKYERAAVKLAQDLDPWAAFDPFGVVGIDLANFPELSELPIGKLNDRIEIDPADLLIEGSVH
jgi:hypothetical protein